MLNKTMTIAKACSLTFLFGLLSACSSSPSTPTSQDDRYQIKHDRAPTDAPDVSKVEDAHPKYEPYSRQGNNMTYTVRGKSYTVLTTGKGFKESGDASWYGSKFHGHLTSNGETYDMYSMSAAHKTLPLPSYVRVTNLDNNKQVIVRVNDRGPFHPGRVIDLSYAAAHRIDMLKTGTARVAIETIHFDSPESLALSELREDKIHYIQLLASKDKLKVNMLARELEEKYQVPSHIISGDGLHRLQLGPIGLHHVAEQLLQKVKQQGYPQSYLIQHDKPNG
ncbi:septal ring lytic transglycosylase RlpA family protein [Shewanella maritima]|uniref:septal ring lytic transglycosylase RlpA family protein n=1 Tax=Shewanella maritima TaxID=2520507 RepID=UPI00373591C2